MRRGCGERGQATVEWIGILLLVALALAALARVAPQSDGHALATTLAHSITAPRSPITGPKSQVVGIRGGKRTEYPPQAGDLHCPAPRAAPVPDDPPPGAANPADPSRRPPLPLPSSGGLAARPAALGVAPGTRALSTSASGGRSCIRRVASPVTRCRPRRCSGSPTTASARSTWCATGPCSNRSWDGRRDDSRGFGPGSCGVRRSAVALLSHRQRAVRSSGRRLRRAILRRVSGTTVVCAVPPAAATDGGRWPRPTAPGPRPVREHAPGLVYEGGERELPVDYRRCRRPACADAPDDPDLDAHRSAAGARATVFTHVVRRGGRLYIQYWLYYPDSNTRLAGSDRIWAQCCRLAGPRGSPAYPGFHRDDWEGSSCGSTPTAASGPRHLARALQGCKWSLLPRPLGATAGLGPVSRGSHSGHLPLSSSRRWVGRRVRPSRRARRPSGPHADPSRTRPPRAHHEGEALRLVPLESRARSATLRRIRMSRPPWEKDVYLDPLEPTGRDAGRPQPGPGSGLSVDRSWTPCGPAFAPGLRGEARHSEGRVGARRGRRARRRVAHRRPAARSRARPAGIPGSADYIVGTSAGSMIGALAAAGIPPWFMVAHSRGRDLRGPDGPRRPPRGRGRPLRRRRASGCTAALPRSGPARCGWRSSALANPLRHTPLQLVAGWLPAGLVSTDPLKEIVRRAVPGGWVDHPSFWAVACDYATGKRVPVRPRGAPQRPLADAVAASCAIPGFYRPVKIGGRRYVDGGVCSASNLDLRRRPRPRPRDLPEPAHVLEGLTRRVARSPGASTARSTSSPRSPGARRAAARREERKVRRRHRGRADPADRRGPRGMGRNLMSTERRHEVIETAERDRRPGSSPTPGVRELLEGLPQGEPHRSAARGPAVEWPDRARVARRAAERALQRDGGGEQAPRTPIRRTAGAPRASRSRRRTGGLARRRLAAPR